MMELASYGGGVDVGKTAASPTLQFLLPRDAADQVISPWPPCCQVSSGSRIRWFCARICQPLAQPENRRGRRSHQSIIRLLWLALSIRTGRCQPEGSVRRTGRKISHKPQAIVITMIIVI